MHICNSQDLLKGYTTERLFLFPFFSLFHGPKSLFVAHLMLGLKLMWLGEIVLEYLFRLHYPFWSTFNRWGRFWMPASQSQSTNPFNRAVPLLQRYSGPLRYCCYIVRPRFF